MRFAPLLAAAFLLSPMPDIHAAPDGERVRIYQLLVRLFGNTNPTRKPNGTLAENGVGKFADINDAALDSLHEMGFTHLWLTGVLQQVTSTDYSTIGKPADDPDLLKGLAGSPYAIKDYFDVCPDYAQDPAHRLEEFRALLARIHAHGMKALIDLVPNHVARSYHSPSHPEFDFGVKDDKSQFFRRDNNFYYLTPGDPSKGDIPPLKLPTYNFATGEAVSATCKVLGGACDGLFVGETDFGRVTGSNTVSWTPGSDSWYETVKLNYGFDFTDPTKQRREYPHAGAPDTPVPDTWRKMDRVLAHWQELGVDGFRCDMAHWVPPEFWGWLIRQARARQGNVYFVAEAYDDDPNKVPLAGDTPQKHVMETLIDAGFDAVYDDPSYKTVKRIYEGGAWANDLDAAANNSVIFPRGLRYVENHDEVRVAAPTQWGGAGMEAGRAASAVLFALSRGPVMVYSGQEVGEPAAGEEGFGGDDARTTIFDYWSMPELVKWVEGHTYKGSALTPARKNLRAFYGRLVRAAGEPAFRDGDFYPLNPSNLWHERYGRADGEQASGHWVYACLRHDARSGQTILAVVNLHQTQTFQHMEVVLPASVVEAAGLQNGAWLKSELLASQWSGEFASRKNGDNTLTVELGNLLPLTPFYLELTPQPPADAR